MPRPTDAMMHMALAEIISHDLADHDTISFEALYAGSLLSKTLHDVGRKYRANAMSAASLVPMFAFDDKGAYALGRLRRGAIAKARDIRAKGAPWPAVELFVKCARGFARAERQFIKTLNLLTAAEQNVVHASMVLAEVTEPHQFPPDAFDAATLPMFLQHCIEASGDFDTVVLFV